MRKLTMLADIPQQCYECVLVGIKPVSQYLKLFFHKIILQNLYLKQIFSKVTLLIINIQPKLYENQPVPCVSVNLPF